MEPRSPLEYGAQRFDRREAAGIDTPRPAHRTNLLVEFIDQLPPTADTEPPPDLSDEHRTQECHLR